MFQIPVITRTPKAGQATWLNRRAAARGMSAPARRRTGTSAASVICPPTQTVAARTCRNSRIVSQLTLSIPALSPHPAGWTIVGLNPFHPPTAGSEYVGRPEEDEKGSQASRRVRPGRNPNLVLELPSSATDAASRGEP